MDGYRKQEDQRSSLAAALSWPTMFGRGYKNVARVQNEAPSVSVAFKHTFHTYWNTHQDVKLYMSCVTWHRTRFHCGFLPFINHLIKNNILISSQQKDEIKLRLLQIKIKNKKKPTNLANAITYNCSDKFFQNKTVSWGVWDFLPTMKIALFFLNFFLDVTYTS